LSLVELFLSYGAEPDIPDDHGDTPLLAATQNKSEKAVDLLLRKKANPNAENNRGYTPLRWAALSGNTALVARLLDGGAEPNRASEFDGVTPVHAVALQSKCPNQEHLAVVALLHEKGASCDTKDKNGRAPMDYALSWNCPTFVEALLRCDAPAAGNMQDGQSYMEFAEAKGFREITRLLRSHR
jgi:serine/threonine-protein phosphatase 6 regulatory ankyrin repeat subunit A